jgi:hypothetical protein
MAAPAFGAAQFYGSMRYDTFYINQKADGENLAGNDSETTVQNNLAGNSRFGVKFDEGKLNGLFEMGIKDSTGANGLYTRQMYGTYKFGGGTLLIGQTYTPWTMFTDQVYGADNGNIGFGALYDGRQPQVKITLDNGLYFAMVTPHNGSLTVATASALGLDVVQTNVLPKLGIGYNGKAGNSTFGAGFAFNTTKEKNELAGWDENINSFLVYGRAAVNVGMVTIKTQVHYGQNLADFGILDRPFGAFGLKVDNNGNISVDNTDCWGGFLQVGAKMTETVSMNVGAGFTRDKWMDNLVDTNFDQTTVFINFPIEIAPHFHVVPEFDYFHYNNPTAYHIGVPSVGLPNLKDAYVFGAKWQMDF